MDVARRGRNAVVQLGVRTVAMRGITAVGTVVLARLLSPVDFGIFAVLVFWMAVLLQFGDVGLSASLVQQDHEPTRDEIGTAWVIQQLLWIPAVVAVWLIAPALGQLLGSASPDFTWQLRAVSLTLVTSGLRGVPGAMLTRRLRFGALAGIDVVQHLIFYGTAVIMAVNGYGAWSFVAAVLAQATIGCLLVNLAWGHLPVLRFNRVVARVQFSFGASYQAAGLVSYITQQSTPLFGWFAGGVTGIGQMQFGWRIGQLTSVFDDVVARVTFPAFSRLQGELVLLRRVLRDAVVLVTIGVVATQGWVVAVAPSMVPTVFGDKWLPAVLALQLICLSTLLTMPTRFLRSLVFSQGRSREGLAATLAGTLCLVLVAPPLTIAFGLAGAGVAYLLSSSVALGLYMRIAGDMVPRVWSTMVRIVALSVPAGALAWLVINAVPGIVGVVVSGVVYLAVYGALLLLAERSDLVRGARLLFARGGSAVQLVPLPAEVAGASAAWPED